MGSDQACGGGTSYGTGTTRGDGTSYGTGTSRGDGTGGAGQDRPGDPACWLRRVCPECGSIADRDPPTVCPQCHAEMPAD